MSVRGKLAATLLRAIQKVLNKDVDVPGIQKRFKATKGRILRLHITDINMFANFKIENGRVDMVTCDHPNATAYFSLDSLLHLINGEITIKEQDGYVHNESYTPFDAWRRGELVIVSENPNEGWLSDLSLFGKEVYAEAFPALKKKMKL